MNQNYTIRYDSPDNKIYVRLISGENCTKKVQIFSAEREFPFLYAGEATFSTDYEVWISPAFPEKWNSEDFVVRILNETSIESETLIEASPKKTRVVFVTPHLSTGGCPQYLLKKIETFGEVLEIHVIEHDFLSPVYVVQRNAIISIVGNDRFHSLGEDKTEILGILERIDPDIVHFEEIPESFVSNNIIDSIYSNPDRRYFITETTHSSHSDPSHKNFLPDKFIFCSKFSQQKFEVLNVPSEVWEYPTEDNRERGSRNDTLAELGLDPNRVHVLNVGLFTPGKNQGELFDIARKFENFRVTFHFVGNQAQNFEHYWGPIMENKPNNCEVWGEREDVDKFMRACDIFYFSSLLELNPIVVKEAISWKMPVLMRNLETYMGSYDDHHMITFLKKNPYNNEVLLRRAITGDPFLKKLMRDERRCKIVHLVTDMFSDMEMESMKSISRLAEISDMVEYTIHYNPLTTSIPKNRKSLHDSGQGGSSLKPGHFGCFEAFRKAIAEDFTDEFDFLVVCERDCVLEKDPKEVLDLMNRTFRLMENEEIMYFSFGDKVDLDHGFLQSEKLVDLPGDFAYLTQKIIGLQFIIFSKKSRNFLREQFRTNGWYGMDLWLNEIFSVAGEQMGILNDRCTTQLDGYSIIDDKEKIFKANVR